MSLNLLSQLWTGVLKKKGGGGGIIQVEKLFLMKAVYEVIKTKGHNTSQRVRSLEFYSCSFLVPKVGKKNGDQ